MYVHKLTIKCTFTIESKSPGAFGKVYSGTWEMGGNRTAVAIKTIKRKRISTC